MIKIVSGVIYIDGIATVNPELVGLAMLDFAESNANNPLIYNLNEEGSYLENQILKLIENEQI